MTGFGGENELDTLYSKIEYYTSLLRTMKVQEIDVYKQKSAEDNYHSNAIEGSRITYKETLDILNGLGDTIGRYHQREKSEITDYSNAQSYMLYQYSLNTDISELFIMDLHYELMRENRPEFAGHIRVFGEDVVAGSADVGYTRGEFVDRELALFFEWYNVIDVDALRIKDFFEFAVEFKYRFLRIHPFNDGNGRMSRLLLNYILLCNHMFPVVVNVGDRDNYLNAVVQTQIYDDLFHYKLALARIYVRELETYVRNRESRM